MDGGDSTLSQSQDLIGSGIVGLESRVDDFKLVGATVGGVGEAMTVVNGGEQLVQSLPASDNPPAVAVPVVGQVAVPVVGQVIPVVEQLVKSLPASDNPPAVAVPVVGQVAVPVVGQVIPVVEQVMDKRKRGRASRGFAPKVRLPKMMKEEDEDVCFICFDGGSLVLCDRRGCPKAYHPACIKRDEAFFRSKARWDCGWHICSVCQRASHYLCYTCTYSLCKKCTKDSEYVCVRGNKGFCTICMKTIMMIENNDAGNKESIQVDFDDKTSWEYLFKMYWILLKTKLSLTLNELVQAKNPCRGVIRTDFKPQLPEKDNSAEGGAGPILLKFGEHSEQQILQEQHRVPDQDSCSPEKCSSDKRKTSDYIMDWASQELMEFVAYTRNGDTSVLSQFDVQAHLMEYIKRNNLQDPHQKSQIICDLRLKKLFGKPRVGHIEMLKLLEYHYLINEGTQKNAVIPAGIVGSGSHVAADSNNHSVLNQSKKQKNRKKGEERAPQVNLDEFAAIDSHNIKLIFLRRSMMENLLDQVEKFHDKVVGSIVRIRVSVNDQKQDIYRLVQVVGTSKGAEPYKIGDKTTDILLEVLNLDKKEMISIDAISNQEFSEDECRCLRQSIKCGLVKRFTVGEIQMKAMALQALRFDDWLVAEILRLSHLRDRANEKGHKKELRECVEKLQVLKTPEERHRKLTEIPEVHADPKMNPNYESEENAGENDKKQDEVSRRGHSKFSIIINQSLRPKKIVKEEDINAQRVEQKRDGGGSNCFPQQEDHPSLGGFLSVGGNQSVLRSDSERAMVASVSRCSSLNSNIETEKMWHYRDPNGKIQGPFSMVQLQKWSTTGYFPAHMSIWTGNEQSNSIFLNDALSGQFHKNSALFQTIFPEPPAAGIAPENRLCVGDSLRNLGSTSEIRSNAVPEGLDYLTSNRSADSTDKQKQSRNLQCSDLPINASDDSSGRPVMHNNSLHTYVDPLHQVPKHDTVEFSDAGRTEHSSMAAQHHSPGIESQEKSSRNQNYCPVAHNNNLHTYVDPLHQASKHDTDEFSDAGRTEHSSKASQHHSPGIESQEKSSRNQNYECQSSGQNRPPVLNLDLNSGDCNTASVTNPSELSELKGDLDLVDLPSPTPKTGNRDLESQPNEQDSMFIDIQAAEMLRSLSAYVPTNGMTVSDVRRSTPNDEDPPISKPKPIDVEDLFNPEPKLTDENQVGQSAGPSEIAVIDIDWSNTSGQVAGGVQTQESAGVWITSSAHAEPSYKEWDFGLVPMSSLKPDEVVGDIGTSNSDSSRHHDSLPSHSLPNVSGWLGFHEPIEFSTLAEESVSDLLAEVDAMESQIGMPSPSSAMRCGDDMMDRNDCFSSIEELSPPDAGKSDAVSSNPDIQFPSQPAENDDPVEASQVGDFNPLLKRSDVHSTTSSEGETKSANYPINIWESRSDIHPPAPCTMNQSMINATSHGWASAQGNMNLGWAGPPQAFAGPPQAFTDIGWRPPNLGTSWANPNLSLGSYNGNAGWDSPHRFNGSRDWQFQGGDLGFGRGRPMWSRQQHGSGGGYSRPPSKGQRVCKFYESGHCKKGASCGYLHP